MIDADSWYLLLITIAGILGAAVELVRSRRVTPEDIQEIKRSIIELEAKQTANKEILTGTMASLEDWHELATRVNTCERLVNKVVDEWSGDGDSEG